MLKQALSGLGAVAILSLPLSSAEQPSLNADAAAAIQSYMQTTYGVADSNLTVGGIVTAQCGKGDICLTGVSLATFNVGDSAGEALLYDCDRYPNCFEVIMAGGGVFDDAGLEALGVSPTQARALTGS